MKGDADVIAVLNDVLTAELTAINQYFIHAMMCHNWRYERLAKRSREESIGEMKHAEEVIERILYLDGVPNMQRYMKVNVGRDVPEQLQFDLQLEKDAVGRPQPRDRAVPRQGRQRLATSPGEDPPRGGRAHRLAGGAAPADRRHRRRELPGPADRRVDGPRRPIDLGSRVRRILVF
jgi:hypothetical protein